MPLRLVFMGTPEFAVPTLLALSAYGHDIVAVYTREPKPAGRGMKLQETPVALAAHRLGIPVLTPKTLKTEDAQAEFRAHEADAAVVVAYGMILPQPILDAPPLGCYNLHGSLLPRWRGAAPLNRAIMAGDAESGVMVMKMDIGLDTGDVAMAERIAITDAMTVTELHDALARLGADLMVRAMAALERDQLQLTKQPEDGVTYAAKIDKAEAKIDFAQPARAVLRHIHGLSPFPGAWCELPIEGQPVRIKVLRCALAEGRGTPGELIGDDLTIACGDGAIRIAQLQRAGKQPMTAEDFLRGTPIAKGVRVVG
ncbi:methionyl-tRNA formyltransferase [Rhodopseudomonas sp. BR0M22]|uniref:methionyl-tRNA formyltransferase n=1 Tax=Rhodopseudomonas sp. BR0M22 TaxID=2269369 RepID=UPI0013E05445|nr:methionyl-tRNA formyltransferase [Rhodopseudomonas sp. BR0M22]NEW94325.1 methionyl-tRNA formyltransferase [Rhodopseudomonas sp. BR0M22]